MKNLARIGLIWSEKQLKKTAKGTTKMITPERINTRAVTVLSLPEISINRAPQAKTAKHLPVSTPQANTILRANTPPAPNTIAAETKTNTVRPVPKVRAATPNRPVLRQRIVIIRVRHQNVVVTKVLIGISQKNPGSKPAEATLVFSYCITYVLS